MYGRCGHWLLELPINTYRIGMDENDKTLLGFECLPEEFVCYLIENCSCRKEFQPLLTMNWKKRKKISQ